MANNYNAQPRPAVVMVRAGEARVIVERETWDDVLRLQRPLHVMDRPGVNRAAPASALDGETD